MAREKKPVHKVQMTDGKSGTLSSSSFREYDIQSAEDIQDALMICLAAQSKK